MKSLEEMLNSMESATAATDVYADLLNTAHVLVAGTTGSGKSVFMRGILNAIVKTYTPSQARYIICDPKRLDYIKFAKTPYCMGRMTTAEEINKTLRVLTNFMDQRYALMEAKEIDTWTPDFGQKVYVFVDELADLMTSAYAREIKQSLQRLAQLGRAAEIHVIAATQCPNRQIIPAEITLNFTSRVALRCVSSIESRQIINASGAEKLPRYGQALILNEDGLNRVSVPMVTKEEVMASLERSAS